MSAGLPGPTVTAVAAVSATGVPTVAFESIEGPPETVFRRLVVDLSEEAAAHQVAVVPRDSPAQYRIRTYLAAATQGHRTTVSWVFDVYDADRRRVQRIGGEELAGGARGSWAMIDDHLLRRIARTGMARLTEFLAIAPHAPGAPAPGRRGPAVADTDPGASRTVASLGLR